MYNYVQIFAFGFIRSILFYSNWFSIIYFYHSNTVQFVYAIVVLSTFQII
jgi:hypothetical protein